MEYTEFTGKNTEDALKKASEQLGLSLDKLEVEVISSGSSGLLSFFGGKKAKVRVRPIDRSTEDEVAKMMKEFSSSDSGSKPKRAAKPSQDKAERRPRKDHSPKQIQSTESRRPERPVSPPKNWSSETTSAPREAGPETPRRGTSESGSRAEDQTVADMAQDVLGKLLDPLDGEAQVTITDLENGIRLEITGGEPGILIGRRGQTLEALQYITTRIVSHQEGRPVKISVDAGGYRKRRRDNMTDLAHKMASKARHTRKPVAVGPLAAQDRRIIHLALRNEGGVSTISRGRGEMKKVIITPRNYS
jgi:spoIIIJ-associated protein